MSKKKKKKWKKGKKPKTFKPGTPVVFDESVMDSDWWKKQKEEDLQKWYGPLGYGKKKPKLFIFLTEVYEHDEMLGRIPSGHCLLYDLEEQKIEAMRHTDNFRKATEDEF